MTLEEKESLIKIFKNDKSLFESKKQILIKFITESKDLNDFFIKLNAFIAGYNVSSFTFGKRAFPE